MMTIRIQVSNSKKRFAAATVASWFETRGLAALLTMRDWQILIPG
jgi:hypothetical protein